MEASSAVWTSSVRIFLLTFFRLGRLSNLAATWVFRAALAGITQLELERRRSWERNAAARPSKLSLAT
jgi:hypothetical protein